jgi:hypothetical protein
MAFYVVGIVICLFVAALGGKAFLWATKLSKRMEELEANDPGRSAVFLGANQRELDELKKVVGVNATAFVGNLKLQVADVDMLKAKVASLEKNILSVANEVADMQAEETKVSASSEQPRARGLPFAT